MATILKNILSFTGLVVGVPVVLPHRLNVNGIPALPRTVEPDLGGFTITADATNVTVTRTVDGGAAVNVLVEFWHTIEAVVPLVPPPGQLIGQVPWIQQPGAGGGGGGSTIIVEDEGAPIAGNPKSTLNFVGAGVTASDGGGGIATITIPAGGPPGPVGPAGPAGADGAPYVLTYRPGSADTGPLIFNDFNDLYAQLVALRSAIGGPPNSGLFKILIDDQSAPTPGTVVLDSGPGDIVYDLQYTELVGALWSGGAYLADHGNVNLQIKDGGGEFDSLTIINALEFTGLNITGTGQDTVFDAQDGQVFRLNRTTFSGAGGQFVLDFIDVSGTIVLNDDSELISSGPSAVRVNNGVVEVRVNGENVYVNADALVSGVGGSVTAIINSSSAVYEVPIGITINSLTMVSAAGLWSPDPNGVLSAEMGVLVSDAATGFIWRNTDGVTAWAQFGATNPFALPEQWAVQNVPASQAGVVMSAQVSTNFDDVRMMRAGFLVGIGARVTEPITAGTLLVEATINGVIVGGAVLTVSNPPGQTLAAIGAVPYVAGDLIGMKYTTDVAFLPTTTDVEAWLEAVEAI